MVQNNHSVYTDSMDSRCFCHRIFLPQQNISKVCDNLRSVNFVVTFSTFLGLSPDQVQSYRGENCENKTEDWATIKFTGMFMSQTFKGLSFS